MSKQRTMKTAFGGILLLLSLQLPAIATAMDVTIFADNNKTCLPGFWFHNGFPYKSCSVMSSDDLLPKCATAMNASNGNVATEIAICVKMESCTLPTVLRGAQCVAFDYHNQHYPAGTCSYSNTINAVPWCSIVPRANDFNNSNTNWDYCSGDCLPRDPHPGFDYKDPDHDWCLLHDSQCCPVGNNGQQSPVNIVTDAAIPNPNYLTVEPIRHSHGYFTTIINGSLINTGHTMTFSVGNEPLLTMTGGPMGKKVYQFAQMHFHWGSDDSKGSEHTINGESYLMEIHLVHMNVEYPNLELALQHKDGLAVMAIFMDLGNASTFLQPFDKDVMSLKSTLISVSVGNLLEEVTDLNRYVTYNGSLTTPGCNEAVTWIVFLTPAQMDGEQLELFRSLIGFQEEPMSDNIRPLQPLNGRIIEKSK